MSWHDLPVRAPITRTTVPEFRYGLVGSIEGSSLERVSLRSSQQVHLSPQGRGRNGRLAPIPGEGATTRKADPPHPDRASAIRPLPSGERYRGLHHRVVIER